jgi:Flp pilus assembly protein TadG
MEGEVMAITIGSMRKPRRGQAMVEFALVSIVAVIVLLGSVQLALVGQLYMALGQMNYRGVRYAAVSPNCTDAKTGCGLNNQSITAYMLSVASPTILTITNANAGALNVTYKNLSNPSPTRVAGDTVQIKATLDISSEIFFKIGLLFPNSLSSTQKAYTE